MREIFERIAFAGRLTYALTKPLLGISAASSVSGFPESCYARCSR